MSTGNTEFIRNAMSKELIFTMGFSAVVPFISDFLQPLANITFYVLILSGVLSALFLLLYLIKKDIRKKFSKYLMASITLMALSGFLYSAQDESNSQKGVLAANFPALGNLQQDLGMLEKDIAEIKESTLRTEQLVESIAEDSKENIKQTKELTETIKDSNEAIVNKLDEINDSFQEISKLGGIIADPKRPEEFYSNARVYEDRGDYLNARRMYNQYFTFKLDFIDPHLRYQTFLKLKNIFSFFDKFSQENRVFNPEYIFYCFLSESKFRIKIAHKFNLALIRMEEAKPTKHVYVPLKDKINMKVIKRKIKLLKLINSLKYIFK